ncbi:MAG TPA: hypothetical protein VHR86_05500, partial [Armatimonadota bacterium]|nr:hypothetical protein [Armatimonadota bacterium]
RHNGDHSSCRGDVQYNHDPDRLRNEWLRPYAQIDQSGGKTGWVYPGRVYSPPGVVITVEPDWSNPGAPDTHGLIRITRSDYRGWRGPDGNTLPVQTMFFELQPGPAPAAGNSQEYTLLPKYWDGGVWHTWDWDNWKWIDMPGSVQAKWRYPFNGILYAEGNIRFRGVLPRDTADGGVRLSVVSRGSIYIEGNVAKGLPADATTPEQSEIALMARDYVTVNTTQFLQVQTDFTYVAGGDNGPPYYWRLPVNEPEHSFNLSWDFGLSPDPNQANEVTNYYKSNAVAIFLRHEAARGPATLQWLVNNTPYLHILGVPYTSTQDFYPLRNAGAWEYFSDASLKDFPLWDSNTSGGTPPNQDSTKYNLYTGVGQRNNIRITGYDPGTAPDGTSVTGGDYNLANVAIQPLDIVIKAMIYAEHQSWFVIPGAFYQDTSAGDPEPPTAERYPKNQEPLDVQIHVIGAIAEGKAASLQDVTQWTAHWRGANRTGYEAASGDSDEDWAFSRRGGINYTFDPSLITNTRSIRYSPDEPAYYLPAIPRLPMCPDLVYCGERPVQ